MFLLFLLVQKVSPLSPLPSAEKKKKGQQIKMNMQETHPYFCKWVYIFLYAPIWARIVEGNKAMKVIFPFSELDASIYFKFSSYFFL